MTKNLVTIEKTNLVAGTRYHHEAWWAVDEGGYGVAGPAESRRELLAGIASRNREVRAGRRVDRLIGGHYAR